MALNINGQQISTDSEGYLTSLDDWNEEVARAIALGEGIELQAAHWEIIHLLRSFYRTFEISPAMRVLVKTVKNELGADKGTSIYLMQLFTPSSAKVASKIAGLPKPANCL